MPSANKPLTGKGEIGASAKTVQTMRYGMRRPLSTDAPAETYNVPVNKVCYLCGWHYFAALRLLQSVAYTYIFFTFPRPKGTVLGFPFMGFFTVLLGRWEFTFSPTLATHGTLLLVGRRTVARVSYIFPPLFPFHRHTCHFYRVRSLPPFLSSTAFLDPSGVSPILFFATAYTPFAMVPRKPNPALAKGPDPGRVDDNSTAFLGVSLVDDIELAKLVSSGVLVEGQAFATGKAVVPKPVDNRTVVFAVFFEAGLRFPCNVLLPEILHLF
jgi:hypothetical protein